MKIYELTVTGSTIEMHFKTKEIAVGALKIVKYELKSKPGINVVTDTDDTFEFYMGWEEHHVLWRVKEIEVVENSDQAISWALKRIGKA